jgi:signal transduction histidine kinase
MLSTKSVFYILFEPNEELTIVSKYSSLGSLDLYFEIFNSSNYGYINGLENIFLGLVGGIIIALIIYNFNIFLTLKERTFLYYILQSFFVFLFVFAVNGVFYFFNIGIGLDFLTASTWFAPILMLIFLMFFIENFFNLKTTNKFFYKLLFIFKIIALVYLILFIYGYIKDENIFINYSVGYLNVSFINCIFILIIAIWGYIKKIDGANYIIIGEGIYLLSLIYLTFILNGQVSFSMLSHLIMPLSIFLEMIFFSLALNKKIKKMKQDLENGQVVWMQEKQYTEYGKIIGNISHQWKQPLSFLSSEIMYLSTLKLLNKEDNIKDEFLKMAPKLNYTIELMSQTIDLFNEFYKNDSVLSQIVIKKEINHILSMYQYKIISNNIFVNFECEENITFNGYKVSFLQIIMTLLDNTIDEFERQKNIKPSIFIKINQTEKSLNILYSDNAGGIKGKIEDIFKPYYSTKNKNSGMGLYILEKILIQKFNGLIKVSNKDNGALFEIFIPKLEYKNTIVT